MLQIIFEPNAINELIEWHTVNYKIALKILKLRKECSKTPFEGTCKPEPLKYNLKNYWSRRITEGDRLIYKTTDKEIIILSCKGHYI